MTLGVVAIVLALTGGAIAASGALTAKQKKEVKSIAKTEAKKIASVPGAPGPAGPAGAKGEKGDKGDNGASGKDGKSVDVTPIASGDPFECEENGGALVKKEGAPSGAEVCNGKEGKQGEPWTPNSTLPPGAIETGSWGFNATEASNPTLVPISFPISFSFNLKEAHVHFSTEPNFADFDEAGEKTVGCKAVFKNPAGTAEAETLNPPGELCVYLGNATEGFENATFEGIYQISPESTKGTARSGGLMKFSVTGGGVGHALGSWAVTGCTKEVGEPNECPAGS
jgi:hypothetical protein